METKEPESKPIKLNISRFMQAAEYRRSICQCTPEAGTTVEQMLAPTYWAHVADKLKPMDRIEVNAEDGSYYAEFIVMSASRIAAVVKLLQHVELGAAEQLQAADAPMMVKYAGMHAKWRVLRTSDNTKVRDGFATREEAISWMNEHNKAQAA